MYNPPVAPPGDSTNNIYHLLCAVQTQANTDAEEMKALRLCIASSEGDVATTREEIRQLSTRYEKGKEETSLKRLALEEQKIRHAGVMEVLDNTRKELTEVADTVMRCDMPMHSAAQSVAPQEPQEPLAPVKLRDAALSLRRKIEMASEEQRHRRTRQRSLLGTHERNLPMETYSDNTTTTTNGNIKNDDNTEIDDDDDSNSGAASPFTVRFRREDTSAARNEAARTSVDGVDDSQILFSSKQRRRKTITFNDRRLEVRSDVSRAVTVQNTTTSEKDSGPTAAPVLLPTFSVTFAPPHSSARHTSFSTLRPPRKTLWRTDSLPEK